MFYLVHAPERTTGKCLILLIAPVFLLLNLNTIGVLRTHNTRGVDTIKIPSGAVVQTFCQIKM